MAGGGSPIGRAISQINQAEQIGNPGSPGYIPPSALSQGPRTGGPGIGSPFSGFTGVAGYDTPRPVAPQMPQQLSPLTQQIMQRSLPPPQMMGLPAALMQMQGQLNRPMMRGPMPTYQNPALAFRPNMAPAREALNRVQPSVYKTELDAARARIAELEAAQRPSGDGGYSGGA